MAAAAVTNIQCYYCNALVPQPDYQSHIRAKHASPSFQDLSTAKHNYDLYYATLLGQQQRRHQKKTSARAADSTTATTLSSSSTTTATSTTSSASSDATLQGSGDDDNESGKLIGMSTTFSAWQERNRFAVAATTQSGTRYVTSDDVSSFRVDRSDQPCTAASLLLKSTKYDIQAFSRGQVQALSSSGEDRAQCDDLIRRVPVYSCLSAHVFTHLKLCAADQPNLLDSFLRMTQEWIDAPDEWSLLNHQTIKVDLSRILEQSQVPHHNCNQQQLDNEKMRYLDMHGLAALLIIYSTEQAHIQSFYAMKDDQAQAILDLLQELIDLKSDQLDGWYKRRFLDAVVRLSRKSGLYPQSLNVTGVDQVTSTGDRGGFGTIFRGHLAGRVVALKELQTAGRSADVYLKDFCQEAVVWRNVHHKNCLPFYGVANFEEEGVQRTCLVSPWMANGNLTAYLSHKPDAPRLPLLLDVASGLAHLHAMQPTIVHGDLKSLNVFITASERACLADFGLATVHDTQVSVPTTILGIQGTAGYMAPELVSVWEDPNGAALLAQLDRRRSDIFAFGCVTYEVYAGGPPFQGNNPTVRTQALLSGRRPRRPTDARAHKLGLDDDMWAFIESLWAHRPESRLVVESARDFLRWKASGSATGLSGSRPDDDAFEWDIGFLNALVTKKGFVL